MEASKKEKLVHVIFGIRIVLWITALGATIYWIYWSFKLYAIGIIDVYEYATYFRPIFGRGLLIATVSICASFICRAISDRVKRS